jgi:hypothetical protein
MLFKTVSIASAVAMLAVSAAVAAPPSGKGTGRPAVTGAACKPKISVILKGTLTTNSAPTAVALTLTGGNRFAKAYRAATQPLIVLLATDTKVTRGNSHAASSLVAGDLVNVRAPACKADLADNATPQLTAVRLVAHPAKS